MVTAATTIVVLAACAEVVRMDRIGLWTCVTLVVVSVIGALVTRAGDRSLPAMMPPLAFLAAALIAGQALVADTGSMRTKQAIMLLDVLGRNAAWVVAATALAVTIALIRHLIDRRRQRPGRTA